MDYYLKSMTLINHGKASLFIKCKNTRSKKKRSSSAEEISLKAKIIQASYSVDLQLNALMKKMIIKIIIKSILVIIFITLSGSLKDNYGVYMTEDEHRSRCALLGAPHEQRPSDVKEAWITKDMICVGHDSRDCGLTFSFNFHY